MASIETPECNAGGGQMQTALTTGLEGGQFCPQPAFEPALAGTHFHFSQTRDNGVAVIIAAIVLNTPQLQADVRRAAQSLGADVVNIKFEFGFDAMGFDSIFFNIVLTDKASRPARLRFVAQ